MTEVMNFFQAMFIFKNFAPVSATKHEIKLAISLKCEAQKLAAVGDEEMRNGQTAQNLVSAMTDSEKIRVFTEIADWHHNRAAEKYQKSSERFAEAGTIQTGKRHEFNSKAKEMSHRAAKAKAAINSLND